MPPGVTLTLPLSEMNVLVGAKPFVLPGGVVNIVGPASAGIGAPAAAATAVLTLKFHGLELELRNGGTRELPRSPLKVELWW